MTIDKTDKTLSKYFNNGATVVANVKCVNALSPSCLAIKPRARQKNKKNEGDKMALALVHLTFPINLRGTSVSLAAERSRLFGYNADYVVRITTTARDTEGLLSF